MATMTKTQARKIAADLRRETGALQRSLEPLASKWVLDQMGRQDLTEEQRKAKVREHLKDLEDLLDQLREYALS